MLQYLLFTASSFHLLFPLTECACERASILEDKVGGDYSLHSVHLISLQIKTKQQFYKSTKKLLKAGVDQYLSEITTML